MKSRSFPRWRSGLRYPGRYLLEWNAPEVSCRRGVELSNQIRGIASVRDLPAFVAELGDGATPVERALFGALGRWHQLKRARFVWNSEFAPGVSSPALARLPDHVSTIWLNDLQLSSGDESDGEPVKGTA